MLLSQVRLSPELGLVRDGEFRSLGLIDHPGDALLVACYEPRYLNRLERPNISAVIALESLAARVPAHLALALHPDPKDALYDVHDYLIQHTSFYGSSVPTRIAETAAVHERAYVAPENVSIGAGALIDPNATILGRAEIGPGAVVRSGSVIGAEGFGVRRSGAHQVHIRHMGSVHIAERAQILSNCTIMRALFGGLRTEIGEETIINAQCYVAHHVSIGKRCRIAGGAVIAGSVQIGDDVWIGPNAVITNGVRIGDGASVKLGSVVIRDVAPGEHVSGHFAMSHRKFLSFLARARSDVVR